ncbi:MAG: 3-oxoacyl-ACP synthase [Planctomycetes bacterium]|nr:3-oxoacyl-ACP synthase [Planctomycetota bacterium]
MNIYLRSLATANPSMYVTGQAALAGLADCYAMAPAERELYERLLLAGPVRGRYVGLDHPRDAAQTDPDDLNGRFHRFGRQIASAAARRALEAAGVAAGDVAVLVTNTCTGYLCPGMSSYLAEDLGLNESVGVFDLMGMGCGGALPNLQCAAGALARRGDGPVLCVAFEVCSATLFMGSQPDLVVSNALFGDGAAAAVVAAGADGPLGPVRLVDFESGLFVRHREALRYRIEGGRLRNVLTRRVPAIGARTGAAVVDRLLARHRLRREEISHWAVHAGGTTVLERVGDQLGLSRHALRHAYAVLRDYGNMSSPSVLFVLRRLLDEDRPAAGEHGVLLSFGAGFTAFAALVEFTGARASPTP